MTINVNCGSCGTFYSLKPETVGQTFACQSCGTLINIPTGNQLTPNSPMGGRSPTQGVPVQPVRRLSGTFDFLSGLPIIYYVIALVNGVVCGIGTAAIGFNSWPGEAVIAQLVGYTVGSTLSIFAVGRVIQLLQQIRNAVRI